MEGGQGEGKLGTSALQQGGGVGTSVQWGGGLGVSAPWSAPASLGAVTGAELKP